MINNTLRILTFLLLLLAFSAEAAVIPTAQMGASPAQTNDIPPMPPVIPLDVPLAVPALAPGEHDIELGWDASPDPTVDHYRVYWGGASRIYTSSTNISGRLSTNATVFPFCTGITYYFAATAITTNGVESAYSNEISWTPRPDPPNLHDLQLSLLLDPKITIWESQDLLAWSKLQDVTVNLKDVTPGTGARFYRASMPAGPIKLKIQ